MVTHASSHEHTPSQYWHEEPATEYEIDPDTDAVLIPLGGRKFPGRFALIDREDVELVYPFRWTASNVSSVPDIPRLYAMCRHGCPTYFMHRLILGLKNPKVQVDHINHDGLDNRRENLRVATNQRNQFNRQSKFRGTSKYKGVWWDRSKSMWQAGYRLAKKNYKLGCYHVEELAARVYDDAVREHQGDFAYPNFPLDRSRLEELLAEESRIRLRVGNNRRKKTGKTSSYRGVYRHRDKWRSQIKFRGVTKYLGAYHTEEDAARAYDEMVRILDDTIPLNFPDDNPLNVTEYRIGGAL